MIKFDLAKLLRSDKGTEKVWRLCEFFGVDFVKEINDGEFNTKEFRDNLYRKLISSDRYKGVKYPKDAMKIIKILLIEKGYYDVDIFVGPGFTGEKISGLYKIHQLYDQKNEYVIKARNFNENYIKSVCYLTEKYGKNDDYFNDVYSSKQLYLLVYATEMGCNARKLIYPEVEVEKLSAFASAAKHNVNIDRFMEYESPTFFEALELAINNGMDTSKYSFNEDIDSVLVEMLIDINEVEDEYVKNEYLPMDERIRRLQWLLGDDEFEYKNLIYAIVEDCKTIEEVKDALISYIKKDRYTESLLSWMSEYYGLFLIRNNKNITDIEFEEEMDEFDEAIGYDSSHLRLEASIIYANDDEETIQYPYPKLKFEFGEKPFTDENLDAIEKGLAMGLPVMVFAYSDFEPMHIDFLIFCLLRNQVLRKQVFPEYTLNQLNMLKTLVICKHPYKAIAKEGISEEHMRILYEDIISGLEVSDYNDPSIPINTVIKLSNRNRKKQNEVIKRLNLV